MKKRKVKYNAVLTKRRKLVLIRTWAMLRLDLEYRHTPEYAAVCTYLSPTMMVKDSPAMELIRMLNGLVEEKS